MDISALDKSLDKIIQDFFDEVKLLFDSSDRESAATKEDLFHLSKQVAYCLDDFRKAIVQNLK